VLRVRIIVLLGALLSQGCQTKSALNYRSGSKKRQASASVVLARKFIEAVMLPSEEVGLGKKAHSTEKEFFKLFNRLSISCRLDYTIKLQRVINLKKLYSFTIDTRVKIKNQKEDNRTSLGLQVVKLVLPQNFKHIDRFPEGRYYDVALRHYRQLSGLINKTLITSPSCERVYNSPKPDKSKS